MTASSTFLRVFFVILGVAFAVTAAMRVRSYASDGVHQRAAAESSRIDGGNEPAAPRVATTIVDGGVQPASGAIDARAGNSAVQPAISRAANAREQRYRELLNAPLPASAIAKPVNKAATPPPIKPAAAPVKPVTPPQKVASATPRSAFSGSTAGSLGNNSQSVNKRPGDDTQPGKSGGDKDPTTDTTPPQVLGIAFDPPQVSDGDSANVIVTATDDMSGIRGISGTVTSPSGKALQGFAVQREAEGSNRYIGRVTIPKEAESGLWHINFLNVSDNASNSVTLSYAQSPVLQQATLKVVSSGPDNTPPTVKAVWVDKRAIHAGEKDTLFVQADDDKSGVALVSAVFLSPSHLARIGVACQPGDGDTWNCSFSTPTCIDCGDWSLEQIQLQDKASNMGSVRNDNPLVAQVKVNIMGDSCDNTPPTLQSLRLDQNVVPSTPDGTFVNVEIQVTDDTCGISSVSAQVVGPNGGAGQFFPFAQASEPNVWVGRMPIPRLAGKGVWRINWLQVMDKGNNLRVYYSNDPLLANATVTVR